MRISDWSSDVCSSDLLGIRKSCSGSLARGLPPGVYVVFRVALLQSFAFRLPLFTAPVPIPFAPVALVVVVALPNPESRIPNRSEEHTSELQSLMRTSYAVFCLKKNMNDLPSYSEPIHIL